MTNDAHAAAAANRRSNSPSVLRFLYHLVRVVSESIRYSAATRRWSVAAAIIIGLILLALTVTAKATAPMVVYPFA